MPLDFDLLLPRNAFSARDAARAGDVWRALQDVAVMGSSRCGWTPQRFRAEGIAFVVREMTTVHHGELSYGDPLSARTWVSGFRRGLLCTRQIHIHSGPGLIAETSQEWAHVSIEGDQMRPSRASEAVQRAFEPEDLAPVVTLPPWDEATGATEHAFTFSIWHTWMDPLAHANHPAYIDWCDEAISQQMHAAGLDPLRLQPVAEKVKWRAGVHSPEPVTVTTRVVGRTPLGDVVCAHCIHQGEGLPRATAVTVRRLVDGKTGPLAEVLG